MNEDINQQGSQEQRDKLLRETSIPNYNPSIPTTPIILTADPSKENFEEERVIISKKAEVTPIMKFSLAAGLIMSLTSAISLVIPGQIIGLPVLLLNLSYGLFAGLFPMNIVNKMLLVLFGLAGIYSAKSSTSSTLWSKWVVVGMGLGAVLGLIPETNTLFGYAPLFEGAVFVHAGFALFATYFIYRQKHFVSHERGFNSAERVRKNENS